MKSGGRDFRREFRTDILVRGNKREAFVMIVARFQSVLDCIVFSATSGQGRQTIAIDATSRVFLISRECTVLAGSC